MMSTRMDHVLLYKVMSDNGCQSARPLLMGDKIPDLPRFTQVLEGVDSHWGQVMEINFLPFDVGECIYLAARMTR